MAQGQQVLESDIKTQWFLNMDMGYWKYIIKYYICPLGHGFLVALIYLLKMYMGHKICLFLLFFTLNYKLKKVTKDIQFSGICW